MVMTDVPTPFGKERYEMILSVSCSMMDLFYICLMVYFVFMVVCLPISIYNHLRSFTSYIVLLVYIVPLVCAVLSCVQDCELKHR